ncbi:MAG: pantoate--beta-alanine ligase [Gammaproteobacteria bacterium]|nr:pantoate--beta-alanine ligase [Gammaproteobacteria bacterium]NIN62804.1 pantoate--beta-alanine ligase [Gammaproteobacteria bacterium]NIO63785.1 pantoate--beta-alanine ligase [Gammaproteobacteria bacterium]NIP50163.1 pantoate--beta-alanine ligase [Gammaproteobacteria bacterium]NIQ12381.1 pantoate--beta-alanine ligase [Gammaproteobacteria bacterium]
MLVLKTIDELRQQITDWRNSRLEIACVLTMGNLHSGHLSLVDKAKQVSDKIVVTIFVNPTQFVRGEDFESYPRTLDTDMEKLQALDVDLLFCPDVSEIYPSGGESQICVEVPSHLENIYCGKSRPGHFTGVATVVTKLFNIVQPDIAVFGEKDYQQLLVIKQLVKDLCFPVEIISMPTVREANGLAMSSRNTYLDEQETVIAATIHDVLEKIAAEIRSGSDNYKKLVQQGKKTLTRAGLKTDYLDVADAETLGEPGDGDLVVLVAAVIGKARLIDNVTIRR